VGRGPRTNRLDFSDYPDHEGGSQKATLVVVVVVVSSLIIPKAFLIRTFVLTLPTDLPSPIFHLFSN